MEVLTRPLDSIRTPSYVGQRPSWSLPATGNIGSVFPVVDARFGPRPPPSPPYEMSKNYSLPPISDLLAISQHQVSKRSEPQWEASPRRSSISPREHRRNLSVTSNSSHRLENSNNTWSQHGPQLTAQPPLTLQPPYNATHTSHIIFDENRNHRSEQMTTHVSRPTVDTSAHAWTPFPGSLASPHPKSAPIPPPQHEETSPRSIGAYREQSLSAPARLSSQAFPYDRSHGIPKVPTLPPPKAMLDEAGVQRPPFNAYGSNPSTSPVVSHTSARTAGYYHPYNDRSRRSSQASAGSGHAMSVHTASSPPMTHPPIMQGQSGNYTCEICEKHFSRPSSLRIHSHSHTGEKPFICPKPACGKAFSVRSNMKRHERGCHAGGGIAGGSSSGGGGGGGGVQQQQR